MEERARIITYKGKEIFYADHRGLREDDLVNNIKLIFHLMDKYKGQELLGFADYTNTTISQKAMDYLKSDECIRVSKYVKKQVVVGITGVKKIFLNVYNKLTGGKTRAFDTEEEAKEWLVQD